MKKNPKDPKKNEQKNNNKKKIKKKWDAQPNEENKNKEREPKPNTKGHDRPFWKNNSKDKRSGNKHKWSLVLKSLKHLLSLQISFSS